MRAVMALVVSALVAGCQTAQPVRLTAQAPADDLASYRVAGPARIFGQALLRQSGGDVVTCAGEDAALIPAVSPMNEAMKVWGRGETIDADGLDGRPISKAIRWSRCDAEGNFAFERLPERDFWIMAPVRWTAAKNAGQGGMLARRIAVDRGGAERVILSQHDVRYLSARPWEIWNAVPPEPAEDDQSSSDVSVSYSRMSPG